MKKKAVALVMAGVFMGVSLAACGGADSTAASSAESAASESAEEASSAAETESEAASSEEAESGAASSEASSDSADEEASSEAAASEETEAASSAEASSEEASSEEGDEEKPVMKSVSYTDTDYDTETGEAEVSTGYVEYNEDGEIIRSEAYNPDGSVNFKYTAEYDGDYITKENNNYVYTSVDGYGNEEEGITNQYTEYTYNEDKTECTAITYDADTNMVEYVDVDILDENGNTLKSTTYMVPENTEEVNLDELIESDYSESEYDEDGNLLSITGYGRSVSRDEAGNYTAEGDFTFNWKIAYTYDENGNELEYVNYSTYDYETDTEADEPYISTRGVYSYDEEGRQVGFEYYDVSQDGTETLSVVKTYTAYDEYGNWTSVTSTDAEGNVTYTSECTYEYY